MKECIWVYDRSNTHRTDCGYDEVEECEDDEGDGVGWVLVGTCGGERGDGPVQRCHILVLKGRIAEQIEDLTIWVS